MNATDILKYGQLTVLREIEGVPASAWETSGACGFWSVKDIVAHLASYEEVLIDILSGLLGQHQTPYLDQFTQPGGQFNDTEVEKRSGKTMPELLDELNTAHARVIELLALIPAETRRQPGLLPWYGLEYALDDLLVYMYYGHKREHSAQIAAFHDLVKASSQTE